MLFYYTVLYSARQKLIEHSNGAANVVAPPSENMPMTLGWVDIRIGTKGKWRSVVSLAKV
jgi:hypothetical protein